MYVVKQYTNKQLKNNYVCCETICMYKQTIQEYTVCCMKQKEGQLWLQSGALSLSSILSSCNLKNFDHENKINDFMFK